MDKKEAAKFLDSVCPGWKDAPIPLHFVKAQAPARDRGEAVKACRIVSVTKKLEAPAKVTTTKK